jgi:DNA (cytosine-5)-methyltransferase 1
MKYLSLCSGIEAATVAWHPLGWKPLAFCEIENFPSAVLAHHWPTIPNLGNMTEHANWPNDLKPDLLVGGTPCQAFSVAGLRKGLADARGNLSLTFCRIADQFNPDWIVWENVPGVLSSKDNAFGCFLAGLAGEDEPLLPAGTKWSNAGYVRGPKRTIAWRVLDAQYFGVAQRRRRVFVVASPTDRHDPTEVLFEFDGVRRDSPPIGIEGDRSPFQNHSAESPTCYGQWWDGRLTSQTLDAVLHKKQAMPEKNRFPCVLVPAWERCSCCDDFLCSIHFGEHVADCECPPVEIWAEHQLDPYAPCVPRFITLIECERLQGFPDNHTLIPWRNKPADQCPDGPRYKALGNSMAVPVMHWIGQRIHNAQQRYLESIL